MDDGNDIDEDGPDIPAAGEGLWSWFLELHQGRPDYGFGPARLTWADMDAWARCFQIDLTPYELSTLKSMDLAYLGALAEQKEKARPKK